MARKIVSRAEAAVERRYGHIRILADGRVRFSAEPGPVPELEFVVQRHHWSPPVWIYDSAKYAIDARRNGESLLFLFVSRNRVRSASFNLTLEPSAFRAAVADLRESANGVERWLAPALRAAERIVSEGKLGDPALLDVIRELLGPPGNGRATRR